MIIIIFQRFDIIALLNIFVFLVSFVTTMPLQEPALIKRHYSCSIQPNTVNKQHVDFVAPGQAKVTNTNLILMDKEPLKSSRSPSVCAKQSELLVDHSSLTYKQAMCRPAIKPDNGRVSAEERSQLSLIQTRHRNLVEEFKIKSYVLKLSTFFLKLLLNITVSRPIGVGFGLGLT